MTPSSTWPATPPAGGPLTVDWWRRRSCGPRGRLDIQVDPDWAELADELAAPFEQLARERGLPAVYQFVPRTDPGFAERLAARGYRLDYTAWILGLTDGAALPTRTLPPGYAVRPFAPTDARAVFDGHRDAFGEWDQRPQARATRTGSPRPCGGPASTRPTSGWPPTTNAVIGTCIVYDSGPEAWVSELATERAHRGRGVAQQLLAETFARPPASAAYPTAG